MNDALSLFISQHINVDVRRLALEAHRYPEIDMPFALDQIAGRQVARIKLPRWADKDGLIFPPHISMEQCSSEFTAEYKASVLRHFIDVSTADFTDITGGFGVDFSYLAQGFAHATYIEQQTHLCEIARNNFPLLGLPHAEVICGDGEEYAKNHDFTDNSVVFIDPARRDKHGSRTYAIADCTPDILGFIGNLLDKVAVVMIKLSPMLDWHATLEAPLQLPRGGEKPAGTLGDACCEIHIVSVKNECKELLLVLSKRYAKPLEIHCVNDNSHFTYSPDDIRTQSTKSYYNTLPLGGDGGGPEDGGGLLLIPNASIMKAGCFNQLEQSFGIRQIAQNSHLFISNSPVDGFPGRQFHIKAVSSLNKKELKRALAGIDRANIACRNFPMKPEELRKRLKLKDGGNDYIFATTDAEGEHLLYITQSISGY